MVVRKVVVMGAMMVALIVAGCGGDEDTTASLSKAEYVKQADAACKQGIEEKAKKLTAAYKEVFQGEPKGKQAEKEAEISLVTDVALPPIAQMTAELGELGTPEGEEDKAESMVEALEEEVEKIEAEPRKALGGEIGEFAQANKLAKDLGLKSCSEI